jgi:hypothetical protein
MRRGSQNNIRNHKGLARRKYAERKIDKYINWSIKTKGYIKYSDIRKIHDKFNIKCYVLSNIKKHKF